MGKSNGDIFSQLFGIQWASSHRMDPLNPVTFCLLFMFVYGNEPYKNGCRPKKAIYYSAEAATEDVTKRTTPKLIPISLKRIIISVI